MTEPSPEDILAREADWTDALIARDAERLEQILDPGFALEILQPAPVVMRRDEWLRLLPDYIVHSWDTQDSIVAIDGDTATVFMRVDMQATVSGADRSGGFILTDVWRRADDTWRVWRRHSTPLTAAAIPRA